MNLQKIVEEMKKWDGLKSYSESYQIGYEEALDDLLEEVEKIKPNKTLREEAEDLTRYTDGGIDNFCQTDPNGDLLWRDDVLELVDKFEKPDGSCPCLNGKPCSPDCTCVNPLSSRGCDCCCRYGSKEQREEAAKRIRESLSFTGDEFVKLTELADQDKCDGHCDDHPPYKTCPECTAVHAINEAAEVMRMTLFRLERDEKI
jgi:hypothetical protein